MRKFSIERIVALLTPLFGAAAGVLTTGAGAAVGISKQQYIYLFGLGTTAGLGAALKWLHGRQWFVRFETNAEALAQHVTASIKADPPAALLASDVENIFKTHEAAIVTAVGNAVKAPPTAVEIAREIVTAAAVPAGTVPVAAPAPAPTPPVA